MLQRLLSFCLNVSLCSPHIYTLYVIIINPIYIIVNQLLYTKSEQRMSSMQDPNVVLFLSVAIEGLRVWQFQLRALLRTYSDTVMSNRFATPYRQSKSLTVSRKATCRVLLSINISLSLVRMTSNPTRSANKKTVLTSGRNFFRAVFLGSLPPQRLFLLPLNHSLYLAPKFFPVNRQFVYFFRHRIYFDQISACCEK